MGGGFFRKIFKNREGFPRGKRYISDSGSKRNERGGQR